MSLLIKNGTVVTATDKYVGDVLDRGRAHRHDRHVPVDAGRPGHRRHGQARAARRHRRAHAPGHALWRHDVGRRLRVRHHRRRLRRHDVHRRFRDSVQGPDPAPRLGDVDAQGRGQGRHRLRLPHDHHRAHRSGGDRDGRAGGAGRHLVQAVHGLSRRVHARRREHLQGAAEDREKRRHHLHARRKRRRHRRAREEGAGRGQDRAEVPRAHPARACRGRGDASRHRAGRDGRRAHLHRASVGRRSPRDGHRSTRPRPAGVRRDLPAVPVPVRTTTTRSRASTARNT